MSTVFLDVDNESKRRRVRGRLMLGSMDGVKVAVGSGRMTV